MKRLFPSALMLAFAIAACNKKEAPLRTDLTGTWQEQETVAQFGGTNYRLTFSGSNAFTLRLGVISDMVPVNPADSCGYGHTEYIRGSYSAADGILTLNGKYSDPAFTTDQPNCNGAIGFQEVHHYTFEGRNMVLDPNREAYYRIELHPE